MYFWNSYPFVRLTIVLILGILCYDYFPWLWTNHIFLLGGSIAIYSLFVAIAHKIGFYKLRHATGSIALFIIFLLGGYFNLLKYHSHPPSHYLNFHKKIRGFSGIIVSPVNERTNHYRYDFQLSTVVTTVDSLMKVTGKIHLYIHKDSLPASLHYGDQLYIYGQFYPVPGPDNPNEFDYKLYLQRQNIYSHAFVKSSDLIKTGNNPPSPVMKWAYLLRGYAAQTINTYLPEKRENGIAKALLLGIKDHLDNEIKKAYSSAGAMHVLAVSGLHVGIIYLLLQLLVGRLRQKGKWGKRTFGLISVLTIWLYATITGLSPSVLRAATMFSLLALGQSTSQDGNVYNTLGFAAFILLIFDPYLIYSVGFQLSFAAVIGIVYLQPKLYRRLYFQSWLLDKAWAITCVSIAAQLATFPLAAYYFHQFPTYFLVSNLIVIPAAFLMLISGVLMLLIDPIMSPVSEALGFILHKFIWCINEVIGKVQGLPHSLIEWIRLDQPGLVLTYIVIITLVVGLHYRSFKTLIFSFLFGLLLISWSVASHELQSHKKELVFYEIINKTAIDYINGHQAKLYIDEYRNEELELLSYQINPHRLASHLRPISTSIQSFEKAGFGSKDAIKSGIIAGKKFIVFDSTTFHLTFKKKIEADIIIINNESVKSLKWLTQAFTAPLIVIGNRNSRYYSRMMKAQASALGLQIHSLKDDGALRFCLVKNIKKERALLPALFTTNPD